MRFLYQPVRPFLITQKFGENRVCTDIKTKSEYIYKREPTSECPVGYQSVYSKMKGHNGLDIATARWQPVYAAQEGTVSAVSTEKERGLGVDVMTKYGGEWWKHRYWHFIALNVHTGDKVEIGSLLGWADSTGISTGDHLHFGLKRVDERGRILDYDNGYFGAVNPEPFMYPAFALDVAPFIRKLKETLALLIDKLSDKLRGV